MVSASGKESESSSNNLNSRVIGLRRQLYDALRIMTEMTEELRWYRQNFGSRPMNSVEPKFHLSTTIAQQPEQGQRVLHFTPLPKPMIEVYAQLLQLGRIQPIQSPLRHLEVTTLPEFDPSQFCLYHSCAFGHSIENCYSLKKRVQEMIGRKELTFTPQGMVQVINREVNQWSNPQKDTGAIGLGSNSKPLYQSDQKPSSRLLDIMPLLSTQHVPQLMKSVQTPVPTSVSSLPVCRQPGSVFPASAQAVLSNHMLVPSAGQAKPPHVRCSMKVLRNFTNLGCPRDKLYERLRNEGIIAPIPPPRYRRDVPEVWEASSFCAYHSGAPGHATIDCRALKHKIQDMIDSGGLLVRELKSEAESEQNPKGVDEPMVDWKSHWGSFKEFLGMDVDIAGQSTSAPSDLASLGHPIDRLYKRSRHARETEKDGQGLPVVIPPLHIMPTQSVEVVFSKLS